MVVRREDIIPVRETEEQRSWSGFRSVIAERFPGAVTSVSFSPRAPYEMAAAADVSVSLIDPGAAQVKRSIARFKDTAYCPRFKSDGRLLVSGCADAVVKVFDVANRSVLRVFKGHEG